MKVQITPEIMTRVWKLHLNNINTGLISETLNISEASARRVVQLMTMAMNGEDFESVGGTNHQRQKQFIKQFFGIPDKEEPKAKVKEDEPHSDPIDDRNVATFMLKVTVLLEEQNELLRQFLSAFGVTDEKK